MAGRCVVVNSITVDSAPCSRNVAVAGFSLSSRSSYALSPTAAASKAAAGRHRPRMRAPGRSARPAPVLDLPAIPPPALGVIARTVVDAWRDPSLRAGLRADPRSVLSGAGVELPAEMEVRAVTMPLTVMPRGSAAGAVLELPLPAATAPPADRSSVGRQLRGTPFEWVLWAAFGPFDAAEAPTARPAIATPADVGRPRWSWRQAFTPRTVAFAGALAAVAVVLMAAPGVLGPLAGAAVGPAQRSCRPRCDPSEGADASAASARHRGLRWRAATGSPGSDHRPSDPIHYPAGHRGDSTCRLQNGMMHEVGTIGLTCSYPRRAGLFPTAGTNRADKPMRATTRSRACCTITRRRHGRTGPKTR